MTRSRSRSDGSRATTALCRLCLEPIVQTNGRCSACGAAPPQILVSVPKQRRRADDPETLTPSATERARSFFALLRGHDQESRMRDRIVER